MEKLKNLIILIRPHHYFKNLFIFAPLFFALKITDLELLVRCFIASIVFSMVAGVVYIINDYKDVEDDKLHPKKKFRPLASGKVTRLEAFIFGMIIFGIALITSFLLNPLTSLLVLGYFFMNLAYSFKLKHIAIVDIFIISLGFVIRIFVGSSVTGIVITDWIVIMVFLLAIFLSLAKRRDDVMIYQNSGVKLRKSIDGYNEVFLNAAIIVTSAVIIVAHIMYTTSEETILKFRSNNLYLISVFVIFGVLRYMQITFVDNKSGSPVEVLLKDRLIQITVISWIVCFGLLIYF